VYIDLPVYTTYKDFKAPPRNETRTNISAQNETISMGTKYYWNGFILWNGYWLSESNTRVMSQYCLTSF